MKKGPYPPLPGASIVAEAVVVEATQIRKRTGVPSSQAVTDAKGLFELNLKGDTAYEITVTAQGHSPHHGYLTTASNLPGLIFLVPLGLGSDSRISGVVLDGDSRAGLEGVSVLLGQIWATTTRSDGRFVLPMEGLPGGEGARGYVLTASFPGYVTISTQEEIGVGQEIVLVMRKGLAVRGKVRDLNGVAIGGARITVTQCSHHRHKIPRDPRDGSTAPLETSDAKFLSDNEGYFEARLPELGFDSYLIASAPGYALATSPCLFNHCGGSRSSLKWDFALGPELRVFGTVVDKYGAPLAGVMPCLSFDRTRRDLEFGSIPSQETSTAEDGTFSFSGIPRDAVLRLHIDSWDHSQLADSGQVPIPPEGGPVTVVLHPK